MPFIGRDRGITLFNPGSIGPRRFQLPILLKAAAALHSQTRFEFKPDSESRGRFALAKLGSNSNPILKAATPTRDRFALAKPGSNSNPILKAATARRDRCHMQKPGSNSNPISKAAMARRDGKPCRCALQKPGSNSNPILKAATASRDPRRTTAARPRATVHFESAEQCPDSPRAWSGEARAQRSARVDPRPRPTPQSE